MSFSKGPVSPWAVPGTFQSSPGSAGLLLAATGERGGGGGSRCPEIIVLFVFCLVLGLRMAWPANHGSLSTMAFAAAGAQQTDIDQLIKLITIMGIRVVR